MNLLPSIHSPPKYPLFTWSRSCQIKHKLPLHFNDSASITPNIRRNYFHDSILFFVQVVDVETSNTSIPFATIPCCMVFVVHKSNRNISKALGGWHVRSFAHPLNETTLNISKPSPKLILPPFCHTNIQSLSTISFHASAYLSQIRHEIPAHTAILSNCSRQFIISPIGREILETFDVKYLSLIRHTPQAVRYPVEEII